MPKIEWVESLSVNDTEIDNQHKKWIEIHNKMHESIMSGDHTTQKSTEVLNAMHEYVLNHFSYEEEYMLKNNYPELHDHKRKHKDFNNQLYTYSRDIKEGKIVLNTQIIKLLKNWLLDHIELEDKKYALFLK